MFKKSACALLCFSSLFSLNATAQTQALLPGMPFEVSFAPNDPQEFTNSTFWTVSATCKISTPDDQNEIYALELKKQGKINGTKLSEGQSITLAMSSGDQLSISAVSGAKVRIINHGKSTIKATCST